MFGKYLPKSEKKDFYLPGEEIKIDRNFTFNNYKCEKNPISTAKFRLALGILGFIGVYVGIAVQLFNLCIVPNIGKTQVTAKIMERDTPRFDKIPIKRADITDRNGTIIATSLPTVNLYTNPHKVSNDKEVAIKLAQIIPDMRYEDILAKLKSHAKFIYIKRNLTPYQQYQINSLGIPGLEFENEEKRIYPHKNLFAHLIGKTNIDNEGISGIEKELNERLSQSDIPVQLTIDTGIQDTIREELYQAVTKFNALGAAAVLMDVQSSEILAMISLPDFDPNSNQMPS